MKVFSVISFLVVAILAFWTLPISAQSPTPSLVCFDPPNPTPGPCPSQCGQDAPCCDQFGTCGASASACGEVYVFLDKLK